MKAALRSGAVTAIGPCLVLLSSMLSLLVSMGAPLSWMRLSKLPQSVMDTLSYLLPALFGALLAQFGCRNRKQAGIMLVFAMAIYTMIQLGWFSWLPGASNYLPMLSCVFGSILLARALYKKKD